MRFTVPYIKMKLWPHPLHYVFDIIFCKQVNNVYTSAINKLTATQNNVLLHVLYIVSIKIIT